ncbi:hypothetical protein ES703_61567 [subsurface metagenome]
MTYKQLKENWPVTIAMIAVNILIVFALSCPPRVTSLIDPQKKVTRAELQLELDTLIGLAEIKKADLDKQEQIRKLILENAMMMITAGAFNPLGLATALFAFYGIGTAANSAKNYAKKKIIEKANNTTNP